jgi:benzoyl-CoA reductase/2-hydroxyglutaryl-CoA dehydratase subunit BcrC/BadD/HgdB
MIELLKLCGFNEHEIESELPRVRKAFNKLGITVEDIERGKQRLTKYYDVELTGVRKALRLIVRELVNALLARDEGVKKVIYGFMAPGFDLLSSALVTKSRDVCSIYHSWAFQIVVGCIFGKIEPILEEAERKWLKAGMVAHCANVKTLVGPIALGLYPKPDLMVTAGLLCETSSKTLDLFHELYGIPVWYIDACQDRTSEEYPEPSRRVASSAAKSLKRFAERIQEVVGFEITNDMLLEVQDAKGKLSGAFSRIRGLVESSAPLPLSPAHENIWMCLNVLALSIDGITEATEAVDTLYEELQERVAKGLGVVEKEAPRVLATLPMGQTDPRLEYLACEVGIAIVATDMNIEVPIKETSEDPYMKFGITMQLGAMHVPLGIRIPLILEGCKKLNIDGVLDRYHVGCRAVAGDALLIENAIKKELSIPVMLLEWENFDPRVYKHEEYKKRLEIFKTMMVKNRQVKR